MPVWSSTGDGLAFLRHYRERGDSVAICSIAKASEALHCTPIIRALFVADVVGWRADGDVVIATSHDGSWSLNTLDLATGTLRTLIGHLRYVNAQLSPSTRYVACWCGTDGASANSVTVLDLAGNQPLIELHSPFSSPFRQLAWHAQRAPVQSDRSRVASGFSALDREVMARAAVSLRAHALSRNADTSLDTLAAARALMRNGAELQTVARIPSPLAPATPRLAALHHGPTDRLLLDEEWSRIDSSRWVSFGDPRPRASLALSGFDPAGDGSYPSGVYSREAYAIDSGLVIEAVIRVPITLPYWQQIEFYLNSDTFVRNIGVWNHRTGTWPAVNPENFFETGTKYPALEGADRASLMAVNGAGTTTFRAVPESFADGRDVLMTITWRPDSTMTVTADGQRIAARRYAPPPSRRMHLFIMGHSVESDVRVRALRIWSIGGVR